MDYCYSKESYLKFAGCADPLQSAQGIQQGDPLGPALFAMAIHEAVKATLHEVRAQHADKPQGGIDFTGFYLDDGVVAGDAKAVRTFTDTLADKFGALGLTLRADKTEVGACAQGDDAARALFDGFKYKDDCNLTLLGAALGSNEWCESSFEDKVEKARQVMKRAASMGNAHCGLHILRACLSYCKVAYHMRTVPPQQQMKGLELYGTLLKESLDKLAEADITSNGWKQAQLGIRAGGLGLRNPATHAAGAYLASFRAAADLASRIDKSSDD